MPTGVKPPIPVGTAKVEALGNYGPATWANVFYFAVGTFDPAHLDDAATLLHNGVMDFYSNVFTYATFPPAWTITTTKVAFRDASDSLYRVTVADAHSGTHSTVGEPAQVCFLVNWTSNDPRRGGKPRTYVVGVPDGDMADSARIDPATLTAFNTQLLTWLNGLNALTHGTASSLELLEMSFVDGGAYRTPEAHSWPIRGGSFSPEVATQRRRVDRLRT